MTFRKTLIALGLVLLLGLAIYTWNRTTGVLDDVAADAGLELAGVVASPVRQLQDYLAGVWDTYVDLTDAKKKCRELEDRVRDLEAQLLARGEDMAELKRLRALLEIPVDDSWTLMGARVLAGRLGPHSQLESFTINRGYVNGAAPGTPVVASKGLVGRVLRASPHTATALLLTNTTSRIAVLTQKSRSPGILAGNGPSAPLEALYVDRSTEAEPGEILVTSGLDGKYPKGIPVARILSVEPSNYNEFMTIKAEPLADMTHMEEVLLLEPTAVVRPPEPPSQPKGFIGPNLPELLKKGERGDKSADRAPGDRAPGDAARQGGG